MPSPFPGMDPYLEGPLWPDVHASLAGEIRRRLVPQVRPKYVVLLEVRHETDPNPGTGDATRVVIPDMNLVTAASGRAAAPGGGAAVAFSPASATVPVLPPEDVKLVTVEVRDRGRGELVTAIETLSPVYKRQPGLRAFRDKRARLRRAGANVLEVDLLRRGSRTVQHDDVPDADYLVLLTTAGGPRADVWAASLRDPLPTVPVPLLPGDPPAALPLGDCLTTIYDQAGYDLAVDYAQPPPAPRLAPADAAWVDALLAGRRRPDAGGRDE